MFNKQLFYAFNNASFVDLYKLSNITRIKIYFSKKNNFYSSKLDIFISILFPSSLYSALADGIKTFLIQIS